MSIFSSLKKAVYKVVDPVISATAHPIATLVAAVDPKKTVAQQQASFYSQPKAAQAVQYGIGVASLAAIGTAAGRGLIAGGVKAVASTFGKASLGTQVKTGIATVLVAPVVYQAVTTNPAGTVNKISQVREVQKDAGNLIANPSVSSGIDFIKTHPVASLITGGAVVAGVGLGVSSLANTLAVNANTRATKAGENNPVPTSYFPTTDYKAEKDLLEQQTNSQLKLLEAQTKAQIKINQSIPTVAAAEVLSTTAVAAAPTPKKKKTKKKKAKKKAKKKPKKKAKKKKKVIKRRKNKKR